ncbi:SDR family NAD(P)-dependent oxidoreductase [Kitasatospora cathayae]|uniref:SDR family NAD(P)-dependent oxidoreductase n=1 Tax=Kitasatospora cathayae TaxID=3004092 RepID=A0ABY7Q8S5_9ACTN|nr:SDR family oxidoreductase [Kitasatospora sp. HUAS 3-15]WBP89037.1 SDR family NAD(P)-dependent oxidoreductase [Kitasatospora sp. HUAS 3-15]
MARTVLITGGTSGIGRATAELFAADGDRVLITGRHRDTVERAAAELTVEGVACDATDPRQVSELAYRITELHVLVNASGGLPGPAAADLPPLDALLATWHANLAQNLLGAVLTTTALRPALAPGGTVISIGSIGAERRGGAYGASKAALAAWNAALSAELGPLGVTANVISPGYIEDTGFFQGALTPERRAALIAETHTNRPGTPADVARTAHFLASPGARHLTGQTLHLNGGAHTTR